jgi:hypothetical protein
MFNNFFFFRKSYCLWDNVEKYGGERVVTKDVMTWCIRVACFISKNTSTQAPTLQASQPTPRPPHTHTHKEKFHAKNGFSNAQSCYNIACLVWTLWSFITHLTAFVYVCSWFQFEKICIMYFSCPKFRNFVRSWTNSFMFYVFIIVGVPEVVRRE